jgi:ribonuclease HI
VCAPCSVRYWRDRLDAAIPSSPPSTVEWSHGVVNDADYATSAHVVCDADCLGPLDSRGGDARWMARKCVDENGHVRNWRATADRWHRIFSIDGEGFVELRGSRVPESELHTLPVAVQLLARSRYRLPADTPVVDHPPTKDFKADETRVNLHAARDSLDCAIVLQAQYQFTHGYACDATKTEKQSKDSEAYYVVARAALRHDGEMLGGRLLDSDELLGVHDTTFVGEKAATDDALADAVDDGTNSRVLLWIDSILHVQCLRRFLYSTARRKQNVHAAGRYAATADLLAQLEVVCYHWQTSHVGCPASEAADLAADASAEAEVFSPVIEPIYSFASMLFPRDETSPRHWAVTRCDAAVAALLRACSVHTVYPEPGDVPLVNIPEADDVLLASVRAERCFHSDGGVGANQAAA